MDDMTSRKKKSPAIPFDVALKRLWNAPPRPNTAGKAGARKRKSGKGRLAQGRSS
jgi:hypothetical protein